MRRTTIDPVRKFKAIQKRTGIPYKILEKVYKKGLKKSPSRAARDVEFFIKNGCSFKLYPKLVNKAIFKMSNPDVKNWCERQIKKTA